jgi:hypothetical protein
MQNFKFFKLKHGTVKKLKHGNGTNFSILNTVIKKVNKKSVPRLKQGKLQNTEHFPYRFLVIKLKHGTEQSNQCICLCLCLCLFL